MVFKEYNYGGKKKEITALLKDRLAIKDKIRYCKNKVKSYQDKIKTIEAETLPEIETKLDHYLGN